jgi:lysozyme family protein
MVRIFLKTHFWDVIKGDQIGFQSVADVIYDFAINSNVDDATKCVQVIVGAKVDGDFGPKTFAKLNAYVVNEMAEELFCAKYNLLRIFRFKDICMKDKRRCWDRVTSNLKFLCGWINRVQILQNGH